MQLHINPLVIQFIIAFPILFLSIVLHEYFHAYSAYRLGDSTAKLSGRLTLNPFKHIDLFGTIIIPVVSIFSGFALIGWAKPVPINPNNFKNVRRDDFIVSFAGPIANFTLVIIFSLFVTLIPEVHLFDVGVKSFYLQSIFYYGVIINLFLGFFNLLPIPPLDGFHLINSMTNFKISSMFSNLEWIGFILLIILINTPFWKLFSQFINYLFEFVNIVIIFLRNIIY